MISTCIISSVPNPTSAVVVLTGRGIPAVAMNKFGLALSGDQTVTVILEPKCLEWYPQPNGPDDQEAALAGVEDNIDHLINYIKNLSGFINVKMNNIGIVGYSAGGVMALKMAEVFTGPAAVASLAGAVLDPKNLKAPHANTPILLRHKYDDECFDYYERLWPTKHALTSKGYNVTISEDVGGHGICYEDVEIMRNFLGERLNYV